MGSKEFDYEDEKWGLDDAIKEAHEQALFWDTDYHKSVYELLCELRDLKRNTRKGK